MKIGDRLRNLRQAKGLTQDAIAQKLSVAHTHVSAWERNVHSPSADHLEGLARVLEVPVSELIGDNDPELSQFLSLPKGLRDRLQTAVEDPEHHANLEKWLDVYEKASPERRKAILTALGEDDEEAGG